MVEVQLFFEGLWATAGNLLGDFVSSVSGFLGGLGGGIRDVLSGISLSR